MLSLLPPSPTHAKIPPHPPLDVDKDSASHRGRAHARKEMWLNMRKLMSCESSNDFWKLVRNWTDDKIRSLPFPLDSLRSVFESCMNPPNDLPSSFDAGLYALHNLISSLIPPCTADATPNGDFSRPFLEEEIDWAKRKVRKHSLNSAKGIDGISYDRIVNFPTADLAALFNMCVEKCDVPQIWLTMLLVGILKPDRLVLAPDNYRLIALECCLLKFMMLLVDRRLGKPCSSVLAAVLIFFTGFVSGWRQRIFCLTPRMASVRGTAQIVALSYCAVLLTVLGHSSSLCMSPLLTL